MARAHVQDDSRMEKSGPIIRTIRGVKVVLDLDLASVYGTTTKRLNEQVRRNRARFPADFMFRLTRAEWAVLTVEKIADATQQVDNEHIIRLRSQTATSSEPQHGGRRHLPYAFTEHGALMAANVLKSPRAIRMSLYVVRAFIKQRELLMAQSEILKKLAQIDAKLLEHDEALRIIWRELQPLLQPPLDPPKKEIGFHVRERSARYSIQRNRRTGT